MKKLAGIGIIYLMCVLLCVSIVPFQILNSIVLYVGVAVIISVPFLLYILYSENGKNAQKRIRGLIHKIKYKNGSCNKCIIGENVHFHNPKYVQIGNNVSIDNGAEFFPLGNGHPSKIIIGNNVHIGSYNRFASMNEIVIEDDVLFAAYVHITDHSHEFRDIEQPVLRQGVFTKGTVRIGKGSWLGFRCNILSGVTIGEHSVIAAGAVVTNDIPAYSVAAGIPARVIKKYDFDKGEWVKV